MISKQTHVEHMIRWLLACTVQPFSIARMERSQAPIPESLDEFTATDCHMVARIASGKSSTHYVYYHELSEEFFFQPVIDPRSHPFWQQRRNGS